MSSADTEADALINMLLAGKVTKIATSVFIAADPTKTELPANINPEAVNLLKTVTGRIYPIALRGKCQAGKSTTLNRIAKLSGVYLERLLEVAEGFGGSTTEGIWLVVITFNNADALLLFDVQGTDRGADELTHKLIALTDHICTKVVDVFRMPLEGFSNEYINSLYCLAMSRDAIQNLQAVSHKAILWTNCVLPKRSPIKPRTFCNTPSEYQAELLNSSVGERAVQGAKAKSYAERTPIITTNKPSDDILFDISQLENNHPFITQEIVPALKCILNNVQPVTLGSHAINDGGSFVEYLSNVYNNIKASAIDLPFCALPMIRSIAMSVMKEKKLSFQRQMNEEISSTSNDMNRISNVLIAQLEEIRKRLTIEFKQELTDLPEEHWQDQLNDFTQFMKNETRVIVDQFKLQVLRHFFEQNHKSLNPFCALGSTVVELRVDMQSETNKILQKMELIPFLKGNMNSVDKDFIERSLNEYQLKLCRVQEMAEYDWQNRIEHFKQKIYSTDPGGVDRVIEEMIKNHKTSFQQQFASFSIRWTPFYNEGTIMRDLKECNRIRSSQGAAKCQEQCIAEFNRQVGIIMALRVDEPAKYGQLIKKLESCLHQYYSELPWPLNDETIGGVDDKLQRIFQQVMGNLFTPQVKERLKQDRVKQMGMMSRLNLDQNESYVWVYCVGCRRIFAGRTRGCVNVTCSHFSTRSGANVEHGCGLTFEWAKAQPVPIETLPPDIWFSNIETDQSSRAVANALASVKEVARRLYSAGPRARARSAGHQ